MTCAQDVNLLFLKDCIAYAGLTSVANHPFSTIDASCSYAFWWRYVVLYSAYSLTVIYCGFFNVL